MNLGNSILNEISQAPKDNYWMMHLHVVNSYRQKVDERLPGGGRSYCFMGTQALFEIMKCFGNG